MPLRDTKNYDELVSVSELIDSFLVSHEIVQLVAMIFLTSNSV